MYPRPYTLLKSARTTTRSSSHTSFPYFGARRLDEITKSDIVRYLNVRRTDMIGNSITGPSERSSESSVRRERGLLQSIFERAIDEGYDIRNPFRGIKRGKDKPRTRVLALDEEAKLMAALGPVLPAVRALRTRYRLSRDEIRDIRPEHGIDWTRGMVHAIGKCRKERDVPMQPHARAALKEQHEGGKLWKQDLQRLREVLVDG